MVWIKNFLSIVLYHTGINFLVNTFIMHCYGNFPVVTILCYHSITTKQQIRSFEKQLDYLRGSSYSFISGHELIALINSPKSFCNSKRYICLTFDDCCEDNYFIVRPILAKRKIPAIFFAVSSKLGGWADWDRNKDSCRLMTPDQLREMALLFDIGSHTRTHVKLATKKFEIALKEIRDSKQELMGLIRKPISFFAYPNGNYNSAVARTVMDCGFDIAFTIEQHTNYCYEEKYSLGRYIVDPEDFEDFKLKVAGGYDWFYFSKKAFKRVFDFL